MFENASLQEAYTGSLIAGKGKTLNNIKTIMGPTKFKTEEWTRVRFGAGTPWRRCWCVISPPDDKEVAAYKKQMKKKSAYDRSAPVLKGDIRFYDTRKTKKVQPIATINDAYSAYSIYPQSKPLIDQSTLIKIEGTITIHSKPETATEGFIFIMPEVRPAISGFEMMLRFLFPIYDVFALYGRPARLAADTLDTRSLMFAMPQDRRYGYLEILDVATLIHTSGSHAWSEHEWKRKLKQLTSQHISRMSSGSKGSSRVGSRHGHRNSLPSRTALRFQDIASMRSTPSLHRDRDSEFAPKPPHHTGSAPPGNGPFQPPVGATRHHRSASESVTPASSPRRRAEPAGYAPSRLSHEASRAPFVDDSGPPPPVHGIPISDQHGQHELYVQHDRSSSESERKYMDTLEPNTHVSNVQEQLSPSLPPAPVAAPPAFSHQPGAKPQTRPFHSPELRRANSRMSSTTLSQLAAAGNAGSGQTASDVTAAGANPAWNHESQSMEGRFLEDQGHRGVNDYNKSRSGMTADNNLSNKVVLDQPINTSESSQPHSYSLLSFASHNVSSDFPHEYPASILYNLHPSPIDTRCSVSPSFQSTTISDPPDIVSSPVYQADVELTNQTPGVPRALYIPSDSQQGGARAPLSTPYSIARKPVPTMIRHITSPQRSISSTRSPQYAMDEAAFNRVSTMKSATSTEGEPRRYSGDSSHYDADSLTSPDSATTVIQLPSPSARVQPAARIGIRSGALKTVGTPSGKDLIGPDTPYRTPETSQKTKDWSVDFGPTQVYKPEIVPTSAKLWQHQSDQKSLKRIGDYDSRTFHANAQAGSGFGSEAHNTSPSRASTATPEPARVRTPSDGSPSNRRSVVWQPGAVVGMVGDGESVTPEQFVQQRAIGSRVAPFYAQGRRNSSSPKYVHPRQAS